jgi:hypothetical protein
MRLLDEAKSQGFRFERVAPGEDGPLWGERVTPEYRDVVYLGGFSEGCNAARAYPTEAQIANVVGDFTAWRELIQADFPAYEAPDGEPPADHRTDSWGRADGAAHGGLRLGGVA